MSDTPKTDSTQRGLENAATPMTLADWKAAFEWMCGHARALERELGSRYVPLHTWKPTHRHADGGLYRLTGRGKYKAAADEHWSDAVLYDTNDGAVYVTTPARWNDRFVPLTDSVGEAK